MALLDDLLSAGLTYEGIRRAQEQLQQFGTQAQQGITDIGREAQAASQFVPFTVTTGLGGVSTTPQGGLTTTLSPQQQALQAGLEAGAGGLMPYATARPSQYAPFAGAALGQAQQALGQAMTPDLAMALQRAGVGSLFGGQLGQIGMPTGLEGITGAALMGGQQRLMGAGQPADISALRQQYAGLAGQAAGGLMQPRGQREQDIYQRIRAAQTPEEERQRLALEGRLAGQGRLGVQTAQFGGTPEQLALAKAQEEAQNQAALMAMQQAGTEQQQAFQQALGLAGQTGALAQLGSGLESEALQRGLGLSQLGLAGTQAGAGLEAQRLQQLLGLQQADIGAAQAQQALQQGGVGLAGGLFGLTGQAAALPSQLQAGDIANLQALMQTGYAPQAQLLNALQPAINIASIADIGRRTGAGLFGEAAASGLEANLQTQLQRAQLEQGLFSSLAQLAGARSAAGAGLFGQLGGLLPKDWQTESWFDKLFGKPD